MTKKTRTRIDPKRHVRSASAFTVILCLLLPIASPIPAFAWNLNLPKPPNSQFGLFAPESSDDSWSSDFISKLLVGPAAFVKPTKTSIKARTVASNPKALANRVAAFDTEIEKRSEYKVGDVLSLAALPVDKDRNVVNGLPVEWRVEDSNVVRILNHSQAFAAGTGTTKLTVVAGAKQVSFSVRVSASRRPAETEFTDDPEVPAMETSEVQSLTSPANNLGSPVGQTEMTSTSGASAERTRERIASSNYSFDIPLASLPGRGIDASVGMTYNSRVWSRSGVEGARVFDFNPDQNWIAPGFQMGFGDIAPYGTGSTVSGYILTGPDGSRRLLEYTSNLTYKSNDGTFIEAHRFNNYVTSPLYVLYPDGTRIWYGITTGSGKRFPYQIDDRNGNYIFINYVQNDTQGKISTIEDTLGRYITFHYETSSPYRLVAVSVPGYDGSSTARQTIRFYYDSMTLQYSNKFVSSATVNAPSTINTLKYIYFPGTGSGYKYDYSPYFGSIYKISQRRGMTVSSSTSTTATGSVTDEGTEAAWSRYNYAASMSDIGSPVTDVPNFTWRQDDWLGRPGSSVAQTNFSLSRDVSPSNCETLGNCVGTSTTTVTATDGTRSISVSKVNHGAWDDGLLTETRIETTVSSTTKIWSKSKLFWEQGSGSPPGRANPRLDKIEITNDANQTRAISFDYDQYNNQTVVREHDFDDPGELGTELRRTETTYETGSGWINNYLLRLPKSIITYAGETKVARTDIEYDGLSLVTYGSDEIMHHSPNYNPDALAWDSCNGSCPAECLNQFETCVESCRLATCMIGTYNPATDKRGNVTKVTSFSDATLSSDTNASVATMQYDVTGNIVGSSSSCCDSKEIEYVVGNHYTYPVSETRGGGGLSMETTATYDFNTGAIKTITDENAQTTTVTYESSNMRVTQVDGPDGSQNSTEYNDTAYPYHVKSTLKLDSTRSVSSWRFSDGRGQNIMNRSQTGSSAYLSSDSEFDLMGRAVKSFNPYTVSALTTSRPTSSIAFTEITERDGLGRTLETTLAEGTTTTTSYDGLVLTVTDQAGKMRRQIADALGRIIRVDEPNSSGALGDVGTPNQPTYYEYDGNDNLTKVTQTDTSPTPNVTQERKFKYDSLSRLTHERQVEASPTLDDDGVKGTASSSKWTGVYKYNTDNLLIEGYDARGVKTAFTYDGLHRISTVVYTSESGYQTPTVSYTYDQTESGFYNNNRLTKVETAANSTYGIPATVQNYRYDKVGQVKKHTQSIGSESYLQEYSYNLAGQLTSQKYPGGKVVEYEVGDFGRLSGVADSVNEYLTGVAFNTKGLLSELDLGNGNYETYAYNDRLQMTSQSLLKGSTVMQKYDYGYGKVTLSDGTVDTTKNNGQLGKVEGWIGSTKQWSQRFAYDEIGRLTESREYRGDTSYLSYKQVFDYDRFGNLYRKATPNDPSGQEDPLPFTAIEETTTANTGDIDKSTNRFRTGTTYNEAGMVTADDKFRDMAFSYDANGRMVKATKDDTPDAQTVYDALGNRVAAKVNDVWRFSIYDAFGKLTAEYGQSDEGMGGVSYIQQDWQGSVRTVSNVNGYVTSRMDQTAFGESIGAGVGLRTNLNGYAGKVETRQGYGLTEQDDGTGLDHTWFRKNDGSAGRWTSPDPYDASMHTGDPQSFNRYSYGGNDPVNRIDPSGLDAISDATSQAQQLLRFAPCDRLISRGHGNASQTLSDIVRQGQIHAVADRYPVFEGRSTGGYRQVGTEPFAGPARTQYATFTPRGGGPRVTNVGIYIDINGQFFTATGNLSIYRGSDVYLPVGERNTMTILHELMHWMGRRGEGADHYETFNRAINAVCFLLNPHWTGRNREPIQTTPGQIGTDISGRPLPPEPVLQPGGWGQADWSFFLLNLLSMSAYDSGGTVTVTGYCVNGQCY